MLVNITLVTLVGPPIFSGPTLVFVQIFSGINPQINYVLVKAEFTRCFQLAHEKEKGRRERHSPSIMNVILRVRNYIVG